MSVDTVGMIVAIAMLFVGAGACGWIAWLIAG